MNRYVLCNDGTRIYFQLNWPSAAARCEVCGDLGSGEENTVERTVNAHTGGHGGKHSVT